MDSIIKRNKVFNLNVIYLEGLRAYAALKDMNGRAAEAEEVRRTSTRVLERLQIFWAGEYFSDWLYHSKRGGFSSDGNVLAMLFGVATGDQTRRILGYIREQALDRTTPLRVCHPVYSPWRVFPMYYLAGIPDYHRTLIWPWLGTLCAVCKARLGDPQGALADLATIGGWYVRSNAVNEVYDREGRAEERRVGEEEGGGRGR